jgi:hypothetical protein
MTATHSAPAFDAGADASVLESAQSLASALADWTVPAIHDLVGDRAARALDREQIVPARLAARAAGREPVALLTRLFALGDALTRDEAALALGDFGVDRAAASGLVTAAGAASDDMVAALVDLRPYATDVDGDPRTWWLASDMGEAITGRELMDDHVLGVGGASLTLASATMRGAVSTVLDLGTGCGIQALHAASHSRSVVATDVSQRALAFASFNVALNGPAAGAAAVELREGSMLEPVAGEAFDLVVSNPPFVITPPGTPSFEYRNTQVEGDGVVRGLIQSVGAVLAPGGVAQLLGNWEVRRGETWSARLDAWLDAASASGNPVDAWVVQRDRLDAAEYAETWLRDAGITPERGRDRYTDAYEAYLADFDSRGVEAVGFGIVTLRRPADRGEGVSRRFEELEGPVQQPLGGHLAATLAARDWLATTGDDALLATRLVVAPDVTQETHGRPTSPDPEHILLRQGGGFGRVVKADTALAGLVSACDGELAVGQIAHALAGLLDVPPGVMLAGIVPAVRELVLDGFLLRA